MISPTFNLVPSEGEPVEPDHVTLISAGHYTFGASEAIERLCAFAEKGEAERAALRLDAGRILDDWWRLGNLVTFLKLRSAA